MKHTGKPSAGKLHAGFDAAGTGTQLTVWLVRHSQRKRRATARPNLRSMAPVLDPTSSSPRTGIRLDAQLVVDGLHNSLPGAKIAFGGLYRPVSKQELNLLNLSAG